MEKNTKYQILKYVLILCVLLFSFLLWRSVDRAIFVKEATVWTAPIVWSSLFFISFALAIFLINEKYLLYLGIVLSLFSGLFFTFSSVHALVLFLSFLLIAIAANRADSDFKSRLRIDLGKNIRSGSSLVIFALGLAIASQYYFETRNLSMEKFLPRFEIGKETNGLMLKIVSSFLPQAKDLGDENMTVDQFLLGIYAKQMSGMGIEAQLKNLDPKARLQAESMLKSSEFNPALAEGRKQLSQIALREVGGDERISAVFSEIVNKKINGSFVPSLGRGENHSLFSAIIAIVILLTATSLGSFLMLLWIPAIKLAFFVLKKSGAVSVALVPAEKEVIE